MKVNIEIDCSPEEARRFMGLPDIKPVQDAYVEKMVETARTGGVPGEVVDAFVKNFAPMGEVGMKLFQQFVSQAGKAPTPKS